MANLNLWKTSGHFDFYKEGMFDQMDVEGDEYQIKPMNCPFHCLIYKDDLRSYRYPHPTYADPEFTVAIDCLGPDLDPRSKVLTFDGRCYRQPCRLHRVGSTVTVPPDFNRVEFPRTRAVLRQNLTLTLTLTLTLKFKTS